MVMDQAYVQSILTGNNGIDNVAKKCLCICDTDVSKNQDKNL